MIIGFHTRDRVFEQIGNAMMEQPKGDKSMDEKTRNGHNSIFVISCGAVAKAVAVDNIETEKWAFEIGFEAHNIAIGFELPKKEKRIKKNLRKSMNKAWEEIKITYSLVNCGACFTELKHKIMDDNTSADEFARNVEAKELEIRVASVIHSILMVHRDSLNRDSDIIWDDQYIDKAAIEMASILVDAIKSVFEDNDQLRILLDCVQRKWTFKDDPGHNVIKGKVWYNKRWPTTRIYMFPNDISNESSYDTERRGSAGNGHGELGINDIETFCTKQYGNNRRVVVIVLARYSIESVKEMVDANYEYWHHSSEEDVDFFWLGYRVDDELGKNATPFNLSSDDSICALGFNTRKYVLEKKRLSSILGYRLGDSTGYLICDYYEGKLHFKDSVLVKIDDLLRGDRDAVLRKVTDCLFEACSREKDAKNVGTIIKNEMKLSAVKEKMDTVAGNILSGAGIALQFF